MAQNTADQPSPVDGGDSDFEDTIIIEKWHDVITAIEETTEASFAASPPFDSSNPSAIQTYWNGVYRRLRDTLSADPNIPKYLTSPPVTKFTATLFNLEHRGRCACCHPAVEPNIVLENEGGVTTEDLLDAFVSCLYGEELPHVYVEPYPLSPAGDGSVKEEKDGLYEGDNRRGDDNGAVSGGVLVYTASWMSCGDVDGEAQAYSDEPNILLYCCQPGDYLKMIGKERELAGEGESEGKAKL